MLARDGISHCIIMVFFHNIFCVVVGGRRKYGGNRLENEKFFIKNAVKIHFIYDKIVV